MDPISDVLSGLSLIAVIVVGGWTIRLGSRSAQSAEESTKAAEAAVSETRRAAEASVRAAEIASSDAQLRRVEAVLDTVLEMRALFNDQSNSKNPPAFDAELIHQPDELARLALCRKLEVRLTSVSEIGEQSVTTRLSTSGNNWCSGDFEASISELKSLIAPPVDAAQSDQTKWPSKVVPDQGRDHT